MRWADCVGHPNGAALKAAGFGGIFLYVGTPGRAKNATGAIYRDYLLSGLQIACVYENAVDDISSGAAAAHAQAAVADMRAMGMPDSMPLAAACDEHLTSGQIPTAVSYQAQFRTAARDAGWSGSIGGYGFSEFTHAVSIAGVAEWLWQCGSASALWPRVTFWQRNDGTATVNGTQVDINEQYLPIGDTVDDIELRNRLTMLEQLGRSIVHELTGHPIGEPTLDAKWNWRGPDFTPGFPSLVDKTPHTATAFAQLADAHGFAAEANTNKILAGLANLATGNVDVQALATALTAALGPEVAKAIGEKLVA